MKSATINILAETGAKMNSLRSFFLLVVFALSCFSGLAEAKEPPPRRIKLKFDYDDIKGSNPAPDMSLIQTQKNFNFKKLIKIRENFIPEAEVGGGAIGN